jgi:hypothetical protein
MPDSLFIGQIAIYIGPFNLHSNPMARLEILTSTYLKPVERVIFTAGST